MRGILSTSSAKNNEEYKQVIKSRMNVMIGFIILGIITSSLGFTAEFYLDTSINEHMLGVYSGVGIALFIMGIILWIKNRFLLNNEEKLKESRLSNTDERIKEISNKSLKAAAYVMLITLYVTALIGGLFYPILAEVLMFISCIFLLSYVIAFKYYNSKM